MSAEKDLYPIVDKFLREKLRCIITGINKGTKYGQVDVLGLRERKSDLAHQAELVAVEVKKGGKPSFLKSIGQAFAYSLYAHRVYLAWDKEFTPEEIDMAYKFGVGLISISISQRPRVNLITSSSEFKPERYHLLHIIDKLDYFECTICHSYYPKPSNKVIAINDEAICLAEDEEYSGKFSDAIVSRRPAVYYLFKLAENHRDDRDYVYDRRYLCEDCCSIFSSLINDSP